MCDACSEPTFGVKKIPVEQAVGLVLAHDITEIRKGEFKGRAFKKGHIVKREDIEHLQRLGKDHLFVLEIGPGQVHEDEAAYVLAKALMGEGVEIQGPPKEGKINIIASRNGLLKIDREALYRFNMLGEVMCATLHTNTVVVKGQLVAGTRAIPLIIKKETLDKAVEIADQIKKKERAIIEVKEIRKPRAGVVITGNEVYYGRIKDAFAPVIEAKIAQFEGEIIGLHYAPDDASFIEAKLRELLDQGADILITTGGMSVDPDDVTRFAIRRLGAKEMTYGSAVLPGAMFLVAYLERKPKEQKSGRKGLPELQASEQIPVLGIPACGMYHKTTIFDLVLPRVLTGEIITRAEIAELGHGGLCLNCPVCTFPVCPFGKG